MTTHKSKGSKAATVGTKRRPNYCLIAASLDDVLYNLAEDNEFEHLSVELEQYFRAIANHCRDKALFIKSERTKLK